MNHLSDISDLQNPCNARTRFGRWVRVFAAISVLGLAACGGDETPSNNVSNNTTPSNNTSQQTVPNNKDNNPPNNPENNPENNPPNNPDCVPTAGGIEICDGIDNDCDGAVDEGYEGLGEPCSLGEGVCEASGVGVCGVDKLGVVCDAQIPAGCGEPACLEACGGLTPVCDADSGNCVECLESTDCPDGVCQDFACVECALNSDCNNGVCHNSMCVECVVNLDCPTGACDVPNNTCVECVSDDTCSDQVCDTSAFECVDCLLGWISSGSSAMRRSRLDAGSRHVWRPARGVAPCAMRTPEIVSSVLRVPIVLTGSVRILPALSVPLTPIAITESVITPCVSSVSSTSIALQEPAMSLTTPVLSVSPTPPARIRSVTPRPLNVSTVF